MEQSIELDQNNSSVQAVEGYMKSLVMLEKLDLKTKLDVIEGLILKFLKLLILILTIKLKQLKIL